MSSVANPQSEHPDADALVAYLDGELPPEECRRVEDRLASDPDYRQQLRDLDQAWEALNSLPPTRADDNFARTTMELVTVAAQGELSHDLSRATNIRRRRAGRWAAIGLAAVLVGFGITWALLARDERQLLSDLPVIHDVNALAHIDGIAFLRELATAVPARDLIGDGSAVNEELQNLMASGADANRSRREWLDTRPPDQKTTLAAQSERFYDLPRTEQARLRELYKDISEAADRELLQTQLIAYGQWLARLHPGTEAQLSAEMRSLASVEQQVKIVSNEVRRERQQSSRRFSSEDAAKLRREVNELVNEHRDRYVEELRRRGDSRSRGLAASRAGLTFFILMEELRHERTRRRLENVLSDEARARLGQSDEFRRSTQLWRWIRESMRPEWSAGELEDFFTKELPIAQRERLLQLPPGEMQTQLEQMYLADQFGPQEAERWMFGNRDGERGRGDQGRPEPPRDFRDPNQRDRGPRQFAPDGPDRRGPHLPRRGDRDGMPARPGPPNPPPHPQPQEAI